MKTLSEWVCDCGHTPCDGLDCGCYLPGGKPRKKPHKKTKEQAALIRAAAWKTRRDRYGQKGHRPAPSPSDKKGQA